MKQESIINHIRTANIHAERLQYRLDKLKQLNLTTPATFKSLDENEVLVTDGVISRFAQLQDIIGTKIFPFILETLGEFDATTYIDKLNRLEKRGYLIDAFWWQYLRKLRNDITHDYIDESEALVKYFSEFTIQAQKLIDYWKMLDKQLKVLIK